MSPLFLRIDLNMCNF